MAMKHIHYKVLSLLMAISIASIIKIIHKVPVSVFFIPHSIFAALYCCPLIALSLEGEFTTRHLLSMFDARYVSTDPAVRMYITVRCRVVANVISTNYVCN